MCALPSAAMVSARWSSANRNRMFGPFASAASAIAGRVRARHAMRKRIMVVLEEGAGEFFADRLQHLPRGQRAQTVGLIVADEFFPDRVEAQFAVEQPRQRRRVAGDV